MVRLAEWEQRAAQYGPQSQVPQTQYERALVRKQQQSVGVPLTTGQKVFREIAIFAVGGVALRGLGLAARGLDWYIRGSRGTTFVRYGNVVTQIRHTRSGRFISKSAHQSKRGLAETARMPDRLVRTTWKRASDRFARSPVGRLYGKGKSVHSMYTGPRAYLFNRYAPREVRYGVAAWGLYQIGKDKYSDLFPSNGPSLDLTDRVKLVPNQYDGAGEPLPPRAQPSLSLQRRRKSKSRSRCPLGHRWSSKARKCVPLRRKRS